MGLFSFFKKNKEEEVKVPTVKLIKFEQLLSADDSILTKLATEMINGSPLVINFESLDIDNANKAIAFLSGVVYACDGEIVNIKEKVYLFGNSEVYDDGTIKKFLDELI